MIAADGANGIEVLGYLSGFVVMMLVPVLGLAAYVGPSIVIYKLSMRSGPGKVFAFVAAGLVGIALLLIFFPAVGNSNIPSDIFGLDLLTVTMIVGAANLFVLWAISVE